MRRRHVRADVDTRRPGHYSPQPGRCNLFPLKRHLSGNLYRYIRRRVVHSIQLKLSNNDSGLDDNLNHGVQDIGVDPFNERSMCAFSTCKQILGGRFRFESNSAALLHLVESAYGGLPAHELPIAAPEFRIELRLLPRQAKPGAIEPPPVLMQSGAGLLCGVMDASNYAVIMPERHTALVVASEDMLSHPYHLRYELIEFATFMLATRGLGLVPLHGACIGQEGRGVLLLGASGSGKSTLALHSLLQGFDFLAEDAVFVEPENLLATGVANYLHVQADALRFVDDDEGRRWISESPVIRRRSGVSKFESDLRAGHGRLAAAPLELIGAIFVSSQPASDPHSLLSAVPQDEIAARLAADQPYAAGQPGWQRFVQQLTQLGVYQLHRGSHPWASVDALRQLLG